MPLRPTDFCISATCVCGVPCCQLRRFHSALGEWQAKLNADVLGPVGLYGKLQSNTKYCGREDTISWLSVATTPAEAARLKEEPVVWIASVLDIPPAAAAANDVAGAGGAGGPAKSFLVPAGACCESIMCCPCAGSRTV